MLETLNLKNKLFRSATLFLLTLSPLSFVLAAPVEIRLGKVHGLLTFAETAIGEPMQSVTLHDYFKQSPMNSPKTQKILERFKKAYTSANWGQSLPGFPIMRNHVDSGEIRLTVQSAYARDIDDFKDRIGSILPASQHLELISALKELLPFYEKYIWNPSLEKMEEKRKKMNGVNQKIHTDQLIQKIAKFYGTNWPSDRNFVISLYPIPGKSGHTMARPFENVASIGILVEDPDPNQSLSNALHEIFHSIYDAQPSDLQWKFEKWFAPKTSKFGNLAYFRINEALATALGSGYVYEAMTGKTSPNSWYYSAYDRYIDPFAKGIYPLVKEYLAAEKTMDENFVRKTTEIFESQFPNSYSEFDNFLNRLVVLVDESMDLTQIQGALVQNFPIISMGIYHSFNDPIGIGHIEGSTDTILIFTSNRNKKKLQPLAQKIKQIKKWIDQTPDANQPAIQAGQMTPGRRVILISADNTDQIVTLIEQMKDAGRINESK